MRDLGPIMVFKAEAHCHGIAYGRLSRAWEPRLEARPVGQIGRACNVRPRKIRGNRLCTLLHLWALSCNGRLQKLFKFSHLGSSHAHNAEVEGSSPSLSTKILWFFQRLRADRPRLVTNLLPSRLESGGSISAPAKSPCRWRLGLCGRATGRLTRGIVGRARPPVRSIASVRVIASRMAVMSLSTAPSVQAA
jgi:hypothetical protein